MIVNTCLRSLRTVVRHHHKQMRVLQNSYLPNAFAAINRFKFSSTNEQQNSSTKAESAVDESSHEDFVAKKKTQAVDLNSLSDEQALEQIKEWVSSNKVFVFMKGEPREPSCGFSNFLIQTLKFYKIKDYKSVDVLKNDVIRKQAKVYSNWPTFPQLYIDGKLIGGSDIVQEMHKDGSLKELFLKANLVE